MGRNYSTETSKLLTLPKSTSCPVSGQCGPWGGGIVLSTAPHLVLWEPKIPPAGSSKTQSVRILYKIHSNVLSGEQRENRESCGKF